MVDLEVVGEQFSVVGSAGGVGQVGASTQEEMFHREGEAVAVQQLLVEGWHPKEGWVEVNTVDGSRPCKCPTRTAPPPAPEKCPFEPVAGNIEKIKQWIQPEVAVGDKLASAEAVCGH
jgi:hypothetical protein